MTSFISTATPITGSFVLERAQKVDSRGYLERLGDADEIAELDGGFTIRQVNRTLTHKMGTIRGLHLQLPPSAEAKIVTCLWGEVFDVVVDVRKDSPTFGKWWGIRLSGEGLTSVFVPKGCAHGLQTLTPNVQMLYQHSAAHDADRGAGINPLDSQLAVEWPAPVAEMSARDRYEARTLDYFKSVEW